MLLSDVVLFDIDDTLYSSVYPEHNALQSVIQRMSTMYSLSISDLYSLYRESRALVKSNLGHSAASHSRLLYFKSMLEQLGIKHSCIDCLSLEDEYWKVYIESMDVSPYLHKIFHYLHKRNVKIGIVTDLTTHIQIRKLIRLGVAGYISALVASEEAGQDKPSLAPYSLIDQKLNPRNANLNYLMIGNHTIKDMLASRHALNANTIIISEDLPNSVHTDYIDYRVTSLEELYQLLKRCVRFRHYV